MKRALFCWEVGEGSGHVVPYLSLIEALRRRGWEVAVVARNTAEVGTRVQASGATLFQAPVCLSIFPEMDTNSFNSTEILLQYGYGHEPTFDGMFSSWLALMRVWQPDLVIGNSAPTAHLTAQCLNIPNIVIGSGFGCPIATSPPPLMRPWQSGIEQRTALNEDRVRQTVNAVLVKRGFARRQFALDMYADVPTLLCTLPELDHFGVHRGNETAYIGELPAASVGGDVDEAGPDENYEIFVYLRHSPAIDGLLRVLAKRSAPTCIYMPNLTFAQRVQMESVYGPSLTFATHALNLKKIMPSVRLIISNAGHNLTLQCLCAGKPLLLLPTHWEQSVVANLAAKVGAALVVLPTELHPKFQRRIDDMLQNSSYREAAEGFARRYQHVSASIALEQAVQACESRAQPASSRTKLTSVG